MSFVDQGLETQETVQTPRKLQGFNSPKTNKFTTPSLNFDGMNRLWEKNVKQYYDHTKKNRTNSVTQIDSFMTSPRNSLVFSNLFKHQDTAQKTDVSKSNFKSRIPSSIQSRKTSQPNIRPGTAAVPLIQYVTLGQFNENKENIEAPQFLKENICKRLGVKKVLQKGSGVVLTTKKHPTFIKIKKKSEINISSFRPEVEVEKVEKSNNNVHTSGMHSWRVSPKHSKLVIETSRTQVNLKTGVPGKRSLSIVGLMRPIP